MKKILLISALFFSANLLNATPGKGGYLGQRFIVGAEGSYSPFFTSLKDFYTKYNFQYGGNLNVIISRRSQLGLNYNMYSLGHNEIFNSGLYSSDRVKGTEYGLNLRTFWKKSGGIAPIGKFYDLGLSYSQNKFVPGKDNPNMLYPDFDLAKLTSDQLTLNLALGTQMVFMNHLVANTGGRFGLPVYEVSGNGHDNFMLRRVSNKNYFSVFFGLGVLF